MKNGKIIGLGIIACVCVILLSFWALRTSTQEEPQISYLHGSYSINVDDYRELTGDADYVFAADVVGIDKTVYKEIVTIETIGGYKELATPYTDYKVQIIENIKGNLRTDDTIIIQKAGGLSKDGKTIVIFEDDVLPEVGNTYIFYAYAQPDGSLATAGPNSSIAISTEKATLMKKSSPREDVYNKVLEGYRFQIETDRDRYKSIYE